MNNRETILNKDLLDITKDEISLLENSNNTNSVVHKFIKNFKSIPFDKYLQQNIINGANNNTNTKKKKKLEIHEIKDVRMEAGHEFLFQIILIEDVSISTQKQLEILNERITGDIQYADRAKNSNKPRKKKVKQLSGEEEEEAQDNDNNDKDDANEYYESKYRISEQVVKIILQDQTSKYFNCITIPDSQGLMKLSALISTNCVPICKPILGTKIMLKNFKYNRGAIILENDSQITIFNNSQIDSWNLNFYSKFIKYWKNGLEARNVAKSTILDNLSLIHI